MYVLFAPALIAVIVILYVALRDQIRFKEEAIHSPRDYDRVGFHCEDADNLFGRLTRGFGLHLVNKAWRSAE